MHVYYGIPQVRVMVSIVANSDPTFAKVAQIQTGANVDIALSAMIPQGKYEWREPKTGIIANMYPSDNTWHHLYNNDDLEILDTQIAIQENKTLEPAEKLRINDRIKAVVQAAPYVKAMGTFYGSLTMVALMYLVYVYIVPMFDPPIPPAATIPPPSLPNMPTPQPGIKEKMTNRNTDLSFRGIVQVIGALALANSVYYLVYAQTSAVGEGEARWNEYGIKVSGLAGSTGLLKTAREALVKEREENARNAAIASQRRG